jgi:hypothetical protein
MQQRIIVYLLYVLKLGIVFKEEIQIFDRDINLKDKVTIRR